MNTYGRYPIAMAKGKGTYVWDTEGKKYIDFVTGIAVNNLGHCHPEVIKAVSAQTKELMQPCNLFHIENQVELAKMLVESSFADKVFFCNTGTEANEGAIKLARKWGAARGGRHKIVHARDSFHGRTMGSLSATTKKYQADYKPLVPGFKPVPYNNLARLEKALQDEKVAAVLLEPIQGENGVILPDADYLKKVRRLCNKYKVLMMLDEIQVGIGRTGTLYSYEESGIKPDVMTLAKALGGGLPCGAILATDKVAKYFTPGVHGTTMGGNPVSTAAGAAVLKTIKREKLLANTVKMGEYFLKRLGDLRDEYPGMIKEVRGKGLILGAEFKNKDIAKKVVETAIDKGLLTILTEQKVMRILPPLNVKKSEINSSLKIINESLKEAADV